MVDESREIRSRRRRHLRADRVVERVAAEGGEKHGSKWKIKEREERKIKKERKGQKSKFGFNQFK